MASIKDLKKRIGSVKNTQQTTRAMKMVSAAKLRRAQEAIQNHRPYARRIGRLIHLVSSLQDGMQDHPLLRRPDELPTEGRRVLLVLLTSDRGLCGAFNSGVIKAAQRWIKANGGATVTMGFVGKKAFDFFKSRQGTAGHNFGETGGKVTFERAAKLADSLVELYCSGQFDEIKVVYNEFKNAVTQVAVVEDFLPLVPSAPAAGDKTSGHRQEGDGTRFEELPPYLSKPRAAELFVQLLEKNFGIQAFRMLLESQAGEHGARMSAMENATKNAGEMIRKLTLQYNKQRQAGITKELLEIIAGSESQKGQ